jgi:hypothetical protein
MYLAVTNTGVETSLGLPTIDEVSLPESDGAALFYSDSASFNGSQTSRLSATRHNEFFFEQLFSLCGVRKLSNTAVM